VTIAEIQAAQADGFRFTVKEGPKIAYYFDSVHKEIRTWYEEDDEYERETGFVNMVMIGDDAKHVIDPDDIEIAPDYCRECGQIGCTHDGMER
jgi:hypothetical protein